MYIIIRTINRKTQAATNAGETETGIRSNHIGDVVAVYPDDHQFSDKERAHFAIFNVKVPTSKSIEDILAPTEEIVGHETDIDEDGEEVMTGIPIMGTVRPRKLRLSKSALKAECSKGDGKIDNAYNRGHCVKQEDIPEYTWGQWKKLWKDKEQGDAIVEVK